MRHVTRLLAIAWIALIASPTLSQNQGVAVIELADEPFTLDQVGLTMRVPLDAKVESTRIGDRVVATIRPEASNWIINVHMHRTKNAEATVQQALERTIEDLQRNEGVIHVNPKEPGKTPKVIGTHAAVIAREDSLEINGQAAARAYILTPTGGRGHYAKGFTIFKPGPTDYVVFEMVAPEDGFSVARSQYETVIATAEFTDPQDLMLERGAAVMAGRHVLGSVDLAELCDGKTRWYRVFRPAPAGNQDDDKELGFRSVRAWRGRLGEIKGDAGDRGRARDRTPGWVVRIQGRHLSGELVVDIDGSYFLKPDRSLEAWSLKTGIRDRSGDVVGKFVETGFRDDNDLKVVIAETGQPTRQIRPLIQGDGYISQLEQILLSRIIANAEVEADLAFYAYQSRQERITLRRESVVRDAMGARTLKSKSRSGEEERSTLLDGHGEPIQTSFPDGSVSERSDLRTIRRLWQKKGLPTGQLRKR